MILTGEETKYSEKNLPSATCSITYPPRIALRSNRSLRARKIIKFTVINADIVINYCSCSCDVCRLNCSEYSARSLKLHLHVRVYNRLFWAYLVCVLLSEFYRKSESSRSSSAARHNILYCTVQSAQSCYQASLAAARLQAPLFERLQKKKIIGQEIKGTKIYARHYKQQHRKFIFIPYAGRTRAPHSCVHKLR